MARAYDPSIENDFDILSDYADEMSSVSTDTQKTENLNELFSSLAQLFADLRDDVYTPDTDIEEIAQDLNGFGDTSVTNQVLNTGDQNEYEQTEEYKNSYDNQQNLGTENVVNNFNTVVSESGQSESILADISDANDESNETLKSIDESLEDMLSLEAQKMRQSKIRSESTPFDMLIAAQAEGRDTTNQQNSSGGGWFMPDMFGGRDRGGRDTTGKTGVPPIPGSPEDKKARRKEKLKRLGSAGVKVAALSAVGYFAATTFQEKWGLGGKDEEPAPVKEDEANAETSEPNDAVANAILPKTNFIEDNALELATVGAVGTGTVIKHIADKRSAPIEVKVDVPAANPTELQNAQSQTKTKAPSIKAAGLAGVALSGVMLGSEIMDQREQQYETESEKNRDTAGLVGGFAGDTVGAVAGGVLGAKVGATAGLAFGPGAVVASPILAAVGGIVGSIGGALAASEAGLTDQAAKLFENVYDLGEEFADSSKTMMDNISLFESESGEPTWFSDIIDKLKPESALDSGQSLFRRMQFWRSNDGPSASVAPARADRPLIFKDATTVSNANSVSNVQSSLTNKSYSATDLSTETQTKAATNLVASNIRYDLAPNEVQEQPITETREVFEQKEEPDIENAVASGVAKALAAHDAKAKKEKPGPKASVIRPNVKESDKADFKNNQAQVASTRPSLQNTPVIIEDASLTLLNAGYL